MPTIELVGQIQNTSDSMPKRTEDTLPERDKRAQLRASIRTLSLPA
jgi:hypothetical protein